MSDSDLESFPTTISSSEGPKFNASEERASLREFQKDPNFIQNFFVDGYEEVVQTVTGESMTPLTKHLLEAKSESDMYSRLIDLFDNIAQSLRDSGDKSCQKSLLFMSSPHIGPALKSKSKYGGIVPDIVVLPPKADCDKFLLEEITDTRPITRFSWAVLLAPIEAKFVNGGKSQISQYIHTTLEYRPDAINLLGMTCNLSGFQFYYMDACAQKCSQVFSWDKDVYKLVHFIYSLHRRYAEDIGRDGSMELCQVDWNDSHYATPHWRSKFGDKSYQVQPIFQHRGCGRRTWVGVGTVLSKNESTKFGVIKDIWRDNSRRFEEGELLRRIHEKGYVPGVVRSIEGGSLNLGIGHRTKHRLVMGSTGLRLSACKSVLEFLKIIYDAIEAHERVMEKGVLHRDISWYNVLCHPEHYIGEDKEVIDQPNIGKILGESDSQPLCLLTDFDNAALINDKTNANEKTARTGTPMFMACELAYGEPAYRFLKNRLLTTSLDQYILEDDILTKYLSVYGQQRYHKFNAFLSSALSGDFVEVNPFSAGQSLPLHQAHHDIESIFWIILWFLAKARPKGDDPYSGTDRNFQESLTAVIDSRRRPGHHTKQVVQILRDDKEDWEMTLHPDFKSLAKMLSDMGDYLCMGWSRFRDLSSCWWHSHEAFKRLLLKEIVRLSNPDNPLSPTSIPIKGPRPALPSRAQAIRNATSGTTRSGRITVTTGNDPNSSINDKSTEGQQLKNPTKRGRSDSLLGNTGKEAKKPRLSQADVPDPVRTSPRTFPFLQRCLRNIEDDDKWFNETL